MWLNKNSKKKSWKFIWISIAVAIWIYLVYLGWRVSDWNPNLTKYKLFNYVSKIGTINVSDDAEKVIDKKMCNLERSLNPNSNNNDVEKMASFCRGSHNGKRRNKGDSCGKDHSSSISWSTPWKWHLLLGTPFSEGIEEDRVSGKNIM